MIVARKYIEKVTPSAPNKRVKAGFDKQKTNLLICSCAAGLCVLSLILSVCFGLCNLIKPNILLNNIWLYAVFGIYAIINICFIYYNYKLFDFNIVFGYVATMLCLALTFISIYLIGNTVCAFIFGLFLLYFSMLTNYCVNDHTKKAHSQFTLAHLFHFYIFIVSIMLTLVN